MRNEEGILHLHNLDTRTKVLGSLVLSICILLDRVYVSMYGVLFTADPFFTLTPVAGISVEILVLKGATGVFAVLDDSLVVGMCQVVIFIRGSISDAICRLVVYPALTASFVWLLFSSLDPWFLL